MTAVAASEDEVAAVLADCPGVVVSAVNGPSSVVISGDATGVEQAAQHFAGRGVRTRVLRVSHAFHSPLMDPMLEEFAAVARSVAYREPELMLVSALTGQPRTAGEVTDPGYWVRHVREPVRFSDAVAALRAAGVRTFIEAGPDGVLSGMGPATGPETAEHEAWLPVLRRGHDEPRAAVTAVAGAWARGVTVDWPVVLGKRGRRVVLCSTYAFPPPPLLAAAAAPASRRGRARSLDAAWAPAARRPSVNCPVPRPGIGPGSGVGGRGAAADRAAVGAGAAVAGRPRDRRADSGSRHGTGRDGGAGRHCGAWSAGTVEELLIDRRRWPCRRPGRD